MKFINRLKYYGIGFGIGLLLVFIFFGGRGCSWTPENRVKYDLTHKIIVLTQEDYNQITKQGLKPANYINLIENGDVDFGLSIKRENPRFYYFSGETAEGKILKAQFELRNNDAYVSLMRPLSKAKIDNKHMPKSARIIYVPKDSSLFVFDDLAKCQAKYLNLTVEKIHTALENNGRIDYTQSKLDEKIKPVYCFVFEIDNKTYEGKAIWYKDRIVFKRFNDAGKAPCN